MQGEQTRLPGSNLKSKREKGEVGQNRIWPLIFMGQLIPVIFSPLKLSSLMQLRSFFLAFDDAVGLSCENFNSDELHNTFCAPHCAVTQQTNWPDV